VLKLNGNGKLMTVPYFTLLYSINAAIVRFSCAVAVVKCVQLLTNCGICSILLALALPLALALALACSISPLRGMPCGCVRFGHWDEFI